MKKEKILIYHHLGLGDHFNCNGLVRYLYKKYSTKFINNEEFTKSNSETRT